jgi:hypothetical protein
MLDGSHAPRIVRQPSNYSNLKEPRKSNLTNELRHIHATTSGDRPDHLGSNPAGDMSTSLRTV